MKVLKVTGYVLAVMVVIRIITGFNSGETNLEKFAEEKLEKQLKDNPAIDKFEILNVNVHNEKNIINAKNWGLPQDEVTLQDIEFEIKETSINGIETENSYDFSFFKLKGENEWKLGREVGDSGYGTPIYELEELE